MTEIPLCWANHQPPDNWDDVLPKPVAGKTLFADLVANPSEFGWNSQAEDYLTMCDIVTAYESFYSTQMNTVRAMAESLSEEDYSKAEAYIAIGDIHDKMEAIDERFIEDVYDCVDLIPSSVLNNFLTSRG